MQSHFNHIPVLYQETLDSLNIKSDGIYVDCTLGKAGHSSGILAKLDAKGLLLGLDQDEDALKEAEKNLQQVETKGSFKLIQTKFSELRQVLKKEAIEQVDGVLADLGVSSWQLDQAERGFSYMQEAPLDMRMNQQDALSAEKIINTWSEQSLRDIFQNYGEERYSNSIAKAIVLRRKEKPIKSTIELVSIIKSAMPGRALREKQHPAKRSFQALRIAVNEELKEVESLLENLPDLMANCGRVSIISFHSLEDRIVKNQFRDWENPCRCPKNFPICTCDYKALGKVVYKKGITATAEELQNNSRSRSARLRCFEFRTA